MGGNLQSGSAGLPLGQPLRVRVTAADGFGVPQTLVRFRVALGGGSVADALVYADDGGFAQTTATLGAALGPHVFEASVTGLPPVAFNMTATSGAISAATSQVSVSSGVVASGTSVTLTLQGRDAAGNNVTAGGATVVFGASGGTSTGTIGATSDNGDGTYTATFMGITAGTATTIGATIDGSAVTTAPPSVSVTPGAISAATSLLSASAGAVASGASVTLTLQGKDAAGNNLTAGGATVVFGASGGTSTGTIGPTTDNGNGTYTATFTGITAGTATTIGATIDGSAVTTAPPTVSVAPGAISAASSLLSASAGTVASAASVTLTLQGRDAAGNNVTVGGATVVFSASGGTSTGSIGATSDNGNGAYTATFTGITAGTPTTIAATIDGNAVTTAPPTVTVTPGAISAATSQLSASAGTVASGTSVTLTLRAKDGTGNDLTAGGATVVFSVSGGTSTGTIGATSDNSNGTYTATFTGITAGTATTIGATINGSAVTTAPPTVTVTPGTISAATSVLSVSAGAVASGASVTLTLQGRDAAGNNLTAGGATVVFGASGGTSTGTIGPTTDNGNGTYTATFTGITAGTATTIGAMLNGAPVTSTSTITVVPSNATTAQSIITVSAASVVSGSTITLTLQARDSAGNSLTTGGLTVVFRHAGGASTGTIAPSPATDHGNGTYTATFTGITAGTATTIGATIDAASVTSTLPTVTVTPGAISAATSVVTTSSATVASGAGVSLSLQARDAAGNDLVTGGATVAFTASGGTSTGTIGATSDNGNGTYAATFTGVSAGTATTIGATINGSPVTTPLATITVVPGATATVLVLPPAATLTAIGATQQFTAEARDVNANVVAGETFGWSSSNAAVAVVGSASGLATSLGNGSATITASAGNGVPGTATLTVAQAVTRLVFSVQPTGAVAGATIAPAVEVSAVDSGGSIATNFADDVTLARNDLIDCFAPLLGTTTVPAIGGVARFTDLRFEQACSGMQLEASSGGMPTVRSVPFTVTAARAAFLEQLSGDQQSAPAGSVLPEPLVVLVTDAFGNPVAGEPVDWLVAAGGGSIAPPSSVTDAFGFVTASWTLGPVAGTNIVQAISGTLLGSPVTFTAVGIPPGTTRLWVGGDASAPTDWSTDANWREGLAPTASDNVFVPVAAFQPVVSQSAAAGDLVVQPGASVTIGAGVVLSAGGSVSAGLTIGGAGLLALTGSGVTLQGSVPRLAVSGQVAAAGPVSVSGDVLVTGSLDLGGQQMTVSGDFATSGQGILRMTQPGELLVVQGAVGFNGGPTLGSLTAGAIAVAGNFVVTDSNSATPFAATGSHLVIFNGATVQQVSGVRPIRVSQSHFQDLDVAGAGSVRPTTALQANGSVVVSSGTLDVGGQSVFVGGDFATTGTGILRMTMTTDLVAVQGNAVFAGGNESAQLFNGVLRVGGDFTQVGTPVGGGSFEGVVSHVVEMNGTAPQTISFGDPVFSHFGNLVIANAAGVSALTNVPVVEGVTVQAGATLALGTIVLTATNVVNDGTLDVGTGTLDVNGSLTHSAGAVLQGSGTVDVTGATVAAFNGIVRPGTSPGLLTVNGAASLGSTAAVEIELGGDATPGTDYDQLRVTNGAVTLAGSLNVAALGGFTPVAGNSFQVLTFGSRVGNFATITGLDLANGLVLDTVWSATDLKLVARQVIVLDAAPIDLAVSAPASRVYALAVPGGAKGGGPTSVVTIDANTEKPVDTLVLDGAANAYALSVNATSEKLYVSDFLQGLTVVDGVGGTLKTTIPLPQPGFTTLDESKNLVYLPAGVFVRLDPNCVSSNCPIYAPALFKVDGATDTVFTADTVFLGGENQQGFGAAFNPNDGLVYAAVYQAGVVRIVDPVGRVVVRSIDLALPWAVALNPVTRKLYVSSDADSSVTVFDVSTTTPSVLKTIPIGGYIPNVTVDAGSNRIYVANYDSSTVAVIDGTTDEVINVLRAGAPGDGAYDVVVSPVNGALLYVARFNAGEITIMRR